ncbi:MGMT family protein [Gryllotalpicola protaetiae]|uniref:MGMT family protein n=1 Tax=Gryllotalpicola protaetiae TaxID=2419771 RepID=UPI001FE6238E|nr:MGMT family protein [Gryllotalpicola protaetiae]
MSRAADNDRRGLREYEAAGQFEADAFAEAVLDIVAQIPPGLVMSYGGIAAELGSRASRQVGKVMAHYGSEVPWWRVVHSDGRPADGHEDEALASYRAEGTPLRHSPSGYRIAMRDATWRR